MAMEFARPWLLALLPLGVVPVVWRRRRWVQPFSSFLVLPEDRLSGWLDRVERALGALFVAAAVFSLAGPKSAPRAAVRWTRGAALMFVLDQSASMLGPWAGADGPAKSKLAVALQAISDFVRRRPGDVVGLMGFGRSTILYTPPTAHHGRFEQTLALVQGDLGDTIIDAALLRALDVLQEPRGGPASRAVVLLSDGAGRLLAPEAIAGRFADDDVTLYWLVVEGGVGPEPAMETLMQLLGPRGLRFSVGEVNELPQALEAIGRLERHPIRVEGLDEGRTWQQPAGMVALGALVALGVFAFGERATPGRRGPGVPAAARGTAPGGGRRLRRAGS